jgi:hypothetical protein
MLSKIRQNEEFSSKLLSLCGTLCVSFLNSLPRWLELRNNQYFDGARIARTKRLEGFNLDVKQVASARAVQ